MSSDILQEKDNTIYANCMAELKGRLNKVKKLLDKNFSMDIFLLEFICLQFRKICELFAFGTLIASKDLYKQVRKDFGNDWNFSRILETVKKINPRYFPKPLKYEGNKKFMAITNDFLLQKDIIAIYNECSNMIHAQNHFKDLKNFYPNNDKERDGWTNKFKEWKNKFIRLFNCHTIGVKTNSYTKFFIAFLYIDNSNKNPQIITADLLSQKIHRLHQI